MIKVLIWLSIVHDGEVLFTLRWPLRNENKGDKRTLICVKWGLTMTNRKLFFKDIVMTGAVSILLSQINIKALYDVASVIEHCVFIYF